MTLILCVWLATVGGSPVVVDLAQNRSKKVLVNFDSQPLILVVKWISKNTGQNFIVKDELRNHPVTIVSGSKVTVEEAYQAFLQALETEGLEVIELGFGQRHRRPLEIGQGTGRGPVAHQGAGLWQSVRRLPRMITSLNWLFDSVECAWRLPSSQFTAIAARVFGQSAGNRVVPGVLRALS